MMLVHGKVCKSLYDRLDQEIKYAKASTMPRQALFEIHGKITMAFELRALTAEEYIALDHLCVYDGINNPEYF